jgi:hypothetical protein
VDDPKKPSGPKLAKAIARFLDSLPGSNGIEHCHCGNLAVGIPDYGPSVGEPVCESHIPPRCQMIRSSEDVTKALRRVLAELEPFGIRFDQRTGQRSKKGGS